jgi:hypothetical protein
VKPTVGILAATGAVSLAAWALITLFLPGPPLDASETMVLVGACGAVVLACRWIVGRFRKSRDDHASAP